MRIDKQTIILTIIIILFIAGGYIMYKQQQTINKLDSITSLNLTPPPPADVVNE